MIERQYRITDRDIPAVRQWLEGKLNSDPFFLYECDDSKAAHKAFDDVKTDDQLRQWCRAYLSRNKWRSLRGTIRSARYRERRHMSKEAYQALIEYAENQDVSLNEAILQLCALARQEEDTD
jgi:hypothetical protein